MTILDCNLASRGKRFVAHSIDMIIATFFVIVLTLILEKIGEAASYLGILFAVLYIFCADAFQGGQSYGKRIMGICVVDATSGKPCTLMKSFIRKLSWVLLGGIDSLFIFSGKRQRLGDRLANTIVIDKKVFYSLPQSINICSDSITQDSQNHENNLNPIDCYLEIGVTESQLQQQETIHIEVPFTETTGSFQLKPEMRNKKVRLRGILEQGANLFVRVRVSTDTTPLRTPQQEPPQTSAVPHNQRQTLRHLDVQIAESFLFYTSIQWNEEGYGRATGIPKSEYDHHRLSNKQLRETIPYYSTIQSDFSRLESRARGFSLYDRFLQILAEEGWNEASATLEQKCTAWLKARIEERNRRSPRRTGSNRSDSPSPQQSSQEQQNSPPPQEPSQPQTSTDEEEDLMKRLRRIMSGDEGAIQRLLEYEREKHPTLNRVELLRRVIEQWEMDNR